MTETLLGMALKEYKDIQKGLVEWIIGLTIAELALIISQKLYNTHLIFYIFITVSFLSLMIAIIIMFFIAKETDIEMHSAMLAAKDSKMKEDKFAESYGKRMGEIGMFISNFVIDKHLLGWLFISFGINTILMILLIFLNFDINSTK